MGAPGNWKGENVVVSPEGHDTVSLREYFIAWRPITDGFTLASGMSTAQLSASSVIASSLTR